MKFGLHFVHQLPRAWSATAELDLLADSLDQVELAERVGFEYAWVAEQHFLEEYSHSSAPELFLAAASQRTSTIRLGHGIVLMPPGYNHPFRVAERIATLDLLSSGRVDFGVGNSKSRIELEGFGVDAEQRQAMTLEALREVARMLDAEPYPGCTGEHVQLAARNVVPKPVQRPHPPLWMACSSDESVKVAARLGIGALTHSFFDVEEASRVVGSYVETFKNECVPIGATVNPRVATLNQFYCHEDGAVATDRGFDAHGFFTYAVRHYYTFGRHRPGASDLWATYESLRNELGVLPIRGGHAIGTPEELRAYVSSLGEVGIDQTILLHQAGDLSQAEICDSIELFASTVMGPVQAEDEERAAQRELDLAPYVDAAFERKADVSDEEQSGVGAVIEAYGLSRPPVDLSGLPAGRREALNELDRMKDAAIEHERRQEQM